MKEIVNNSQAKDILENYFKILKSHTSILPKKESEDIIKEIKSHIYESIQHSDLSDEVDSTLNAINSLGDPEDYLLPLIDQKLTSASTRSLNPILAIKTMFYSSKNSFYGAIQLFFFSIFYVISVLFLFVAIIKLFYPDAGLYLNPDNTIALGYSDTPGAAELLGYWIIPLAITLSGLSYLTITKILNRIK